MSETTTPTVQIDLSGEILTLTPTLEAAMGISAAFGGFYAASQRAMAGDLMAIAAIIRWGAGLKPKDEKDLIAKVFAAGITIPAAETTRFTWILINGGKERGEAEPGEAQPNGQSPG